MKISKIAVIGLGHWGPNYLRNFSQLDACAIVACVDQNPERIKVFAAHYPNVHFYTSLKELYAKETVDASIIATPTTTHYPIAKECLKHNQHLLIEKPLAMSVKECVELSKLAKQKKRILMVGHTFLYNNAVMWLKNFMRSGEAGKIYYLHAERTNLGPIRQDVNAMVDLAPHDISIFLHLLGLRPKAVSAHGAAFLNGQEDVAFLTLYFAKNILGHIHVSWLDPRKVRQITVIGDKKMVLFDDINVFEPIRIYDKGVKQKKDVMDFSQFKYILYDGDVVIPKVKLDEPLKNQCREFLNCIQNHRQPLSNVELGADVVRVLAGAALSLKQKGKIVALRNL